MAALAGFLTSREAARGDDRARGRGTILFTGATASVRGGAGFSAFAGAKHALRALAQSLARELGPKGVHVAHVVIDGAIDGAFIRGLMPDAAEQLAREEILVPDEIARNYVWLHQPEARRLDLRNGPAALDGDMVMSATIEFIFDFGSPNVYLAYRALPPILERTGATARHQPLPARRHLQGDRATSRRWSPSRRSRASSNTRCWRSRRFVARHRIRQVPPQPAFPGQHADADARARRRPGGGLRSRLSRDGSQGHVGGGPQARRQGGAGGRHRCRGARSARACWRAAQTDPIKQKLADNTAAAVARGVFGIPTFFVGDEMFFGKERLGQVEEAVEAVGAGPAEA